MAAIGPPPYPSLEHGLWDEWAQAAQEGFSNLGTYNSTSKLPSGRPSDHARYPSRAFDAGFSPETGYNNPQARRFFNEMIGRPGVHYVILGNKIWSTDQGLHPYKYGGHEGHVHVSGTGADVGSSQQIPGALYGTALVEFLAEGAARRDINPGAVLSDVAAEGGFFGAKGDSGTSYGPFSLHEGGLLPANIDNPEAWAQKPAGLNYALNLIQRYAAGLPAHPAIEHIVRDFENPRDENAQIAKIDIIYRKAGAAGALPPTRAELQQVSAKSWLKSWWNTIGGPGSPGGDIGKGTGADLLPGGDGGLLGNLGEVGKFFHIIAWPFQHPVRSGQILAGSILVLVGIYLLGRAFGVSPPVPGVVAGMAQSIK